MARDEYSSHQHRVQSDGANLSYIQYNISRNQKLYFADRLSRQVGRFTIPQDWSVSYQNLPDGSAPGWVKALTRSVQASSEGALYAYQNRIDLQIAYEGLIAETVKLRQQSREVPIDQALKSALQRMAHREGGDGPISRMLAKYSFTDHRFRVLTSEDPRLLSQSMRGSSSPIHSTEQMHDRVVGIGRLMKQGNEITFGTHTAFGLQLAIDADGDQLTHGLVFIDRETGQAKRMITSKAPGHRRMGYFKIENDLTPLEYLQQSELGLRAYSMPHYGNVLESVRHQALNPLSTEIERIHNRRAVSKILQTEGGYEAFKSMGEPFQEEVRGLTKMITRGVDIGGLHNKVVAREVYRALGQMAKGDITGLSVQELNQFLAGELGKGDERFKILELNALKQVKKSGVVQIGEDDIEDFNLMFEDLVRMYSQKSKTLSSMNKVQYLEMIGDLVGERGIEAIGKSDPAALQKIFEANYYSLGAGVRSVDNPFKEAYKKPDKIRRRRMGKNPLMEDNGGLFDVLEESGFWELKPVLAPDEMIVNERQAEFGRMYALFENPNVGFANDLKTPLGGTENADGLIHTGVTRPTLISDAEKKVQLALNGRESIRRYMNNTLRGGYQTKFKGQAVTVRIGQAENLYDPKNMKLQIHARRIANDFVDSGLDVVHTGLPNESQFRAKRIDLMTRIVQQKAMLPEGSDELKRFIVQAQLASDEGQKLVNEASEASKRYFSEFGFQADVGHRGKHAVLQSLDLTRSRANQINISLTSHTNDAEELAEAIIYGRQKYEIADGAGKMKNNRTVAVELGRETGLQSRLGSDFGASAKRTELMRSQLSSIAYEAQVGYTEIDLVDSLRKGTTLSRQQMADNMFAGLDEGINATGRQDRSGVGMVLTTQRMNDYFVQEVQNNPQAALNLDNLSDEEAKKLGAYRKNGKWVLSLRDWDNLRQYTKLVDETGTFKIEQTLVNSIRTTSGTELDALAFGGEIASKRKFGDLAQNLFTMGAARKGWSDDQTLDTLMEMQTNIRSMVDTFEQGGMTERQLNDDLLSMYERYLGQVGVSSQDVEVRQGNEIKRLKAYVMSQKLYMVMNHTELPNVLSDPRALDVGSEYGQKQVADLAHSVASIASDDFGAGFEATKKELAMELLEVGKHSKRTLRDQQGSVTNDKLLKMAEQNEIVAAQLYDMLQLGSNRTQAALSPQDAFNAGRRAAMAEYMGGQVMDKMGQHLGEVFGKVNFKSTAIGAGVLVGAQLLKGRKESKNRKS